MHPFFTIRSGFYANLTLKNLIFWLNLYSTPCPSGGTLDVCCGKKLMQALSERRFFCFNLDANRLAENKLTLWTRLFSSFVKKQCRALMFRATSSSSDVAVSDTDNSSYLWCTDADSLCMTCTPWCPTFILFTVDVA